MSAGRAVAAAVGLLALTALAGCGDDGSDDGSGGDRAGPVTTVTTSTTSTTAATDDRPDVMGIAAAEIDRFLESAGYSFAEQVIELQVSDDGAELRLVLDVAVDELSVADPACRELVGFLVLHPEGRGEVGLTVVASPGGEAPGTPVVVDERVAPNEPGECRPLS